MRRQISRLLVSNREAEENVNVLLLLHGKQEAQGTSSLCFSYISITFEGSFHVGGGFVVLDLGINNCKQDRFRVYNYTRMTVI